MDHVHKHNICINVLSSQIVDLLHKFRVVSLPCFLTYLSPFLYVIELHVEANVERHIPQINRTNI
jgi:hypothetical protein